ncbi:transcriptional regulator [Cellvibrio sp. PSBB006]|nr:transcriptional regulator [Cellvibrio sp. PSBB006]
MSPTSNDFASTVKALRTQLHLSQEDLAKELGVSFATVNRWENQKTQPSKLARRQLEQFIASQKEQGALTHE